MAYDSYILCDEDYDKTKYIYSQHLMTSAIVKEIGDPQSL